MEQQQLYGNQGYNFDRLPRKTITIQILAADLAKTSNIYDLIEPLTIDKLSDVYIDSFVSNNVAPTGTATDLATEIFILGIKEFNIQSVSNKQLYHNKLIIPNTTGSSEAVTTTVTHRATKFNFIGTVNPTTLSSLEISLTNSAGNAFDNGVFPTTAKVWITFMIVARD